MPVADQTMHSATLSVLVENEAGVLARVIGLFSGRGYNIDSLTVAPVDASRAQSRINVVTSGTEMVIAQIKAQLDRLVPVYRVADLTRQGPYIARELALIKVVSEGDARSEQLRVRVDRRDGKDRRLRGTHAAARPRRDFAQRRRGDRARTGDHLGKPACKGRAVFDPRYAPFGT